jgi:hypothetical protein
MKVNFSNRFLKHASEDINHADEDFKFAHRNIDLR